MEAQSKHYYPSFLLQFRGRKFEPVALHAAFDVARIGGTVRGAEDAEQFFREFKIDEAHWEYHQRILHDDVLFRLLSEGYLHPNVHPVAAIYYDSWFYSFVFPFIHTAIVKKMATAVRTDNLETVKLLVQWIEPFGSYFHEPFYSIIKFTANEILAELRTLQVNRKLLPFDTYSKLSPALMHLLNRLPEKDQSFRDRFAQEVLQFAVWLHGEMKVYSQPSGMLTRLKLLNSSPDVHAQVNIQLNAWEKQRELASKEKFNLNHLIWIIPGVFIIAFVIFRNTEFGRSYEDIQADHEMDLIAQQEQMDDKWEKIRLRMENIDLNKLIAEELFVAGPLSVSGRPIDPDKDPGRINSGAEPYKDWLKPGREVYAAYDESLEILNESECDMVVFVRQSKAPYLERAYYIRSHRSMTVYDQGQKQYYMRVYAGVGWTDSLVVAGYDQKLLNAGVPEETKDQFPATTELRGRFTYTAKSMEENLQPGLSSMYEQSFTNANGIPYVIIEGDLNKISYRPAN